VDQAQFDAITAFIRGLNSSGTLSSSDLSVLNNAILGVFSNTYTPAYVGKTPEQLMADYAPNFFTAEQTGDPILQGITEDIAKGFDLWTIKQRVKAILENDPNITGGSVETQDYLNQAETYYREWNAYNKAQREDAQAKIDNDPFRKNGLPGFEERYDPEQVFASEFAKTADIFSKRRKEASANQTKLQPTNTSEGAVRINPENPKYNPINLASTPVVQGNVADAIRGDKQKISDKDFLNFIEAIDKSTKMVLQDPSMAAVYYRDPNLNAKTLAADLRKKLASGLMAGADPLKGGTGKERNRPFTETEKMAIQQYIAQLEQQNTPTRTKTIVSSSQTPGGLRLNKNPISPEEMAAKARAASGLTKNYEDAVRAEMTRLLSAKLEEEGRTPLKDELTARGLVATAAYKPKATSTKAKNYTVKGSQIVKLGQ